MEGNAGGEIGDRIFNACNSFIMNNLVNRGETIINFKRIFFCEKVI